MASHMSANVRRGGTGRRRMSVAAAWLRLLTWLGRAFGDERETSS